MGASAVPLYFFTSWLLLFIPKMKSGLVVQMVRVWWAYCQLSERCHPSVRKATPAGLLYTPSMPMAPSRAIMRLKARFWLVLVRMPPACAGCHAVKARENSEIAKIFFII